ncbi:MAG: matrixin family metalloprotease, partial [Aliifodinibius sp.]|nr:matrixin family metalloprotease [Fodinibius sp.]NIV14644.1 matrixin family metalloprotease [Fodinibius sp.]NIY28538.1 matrixin family metalloprotease [Fodinibius sp.]
MWTALEGAVKQWTSGDSPETTVAVTLGEESSYDIGWDTYNNILFMDDFDAQGISAKALTLMYVEIDEYSTNQYHASMWETDIVLNNDQSSHTWNTNGNMDFASNLDLQSVITHEMGHAIGIGHSYLGKQFVNG